MTKQDTITDALRWAGNSFLLDSLFDQSPLELFVVDEKFKIVKASKYLAHQMCGQPPEFMLGKSLSQILGRKTWNKLRSVFLEGLQGKYVHDLHVTLNETVQGETERHYLLTIYPLPVIEEGKLLGGLFQEVTKQFDAEDKLLSYQNRLEMAQNAGGVGLFDWDFETNEVWSSPEEIELFELRNSTKEGTLEHWLNKIHPEDKNRILKLIQESSENQAAFDTEYRILLSNNRMRWIRGKGKFYYNDKGDAVQLVGVNYDVTKRKRDEQFLRFKADTSRVLVSSLNAEKALQQMCDLATRHVADWCGVDLLEDGILKQSSFSFKDEKNKAVAEKCRKMYDTTLGLGEVLTDVIKSKSPMVISSMDSLKPSKKTQSILKLEKELNINSALILPLIVHDEPVGTISFFLAKTHDRYIESDLDLAQQLATRVALYIENTKLYNQVKLERRHLLKLFENVPCIVFESTGVVDQPNYKTTFINTFAEELLGYPIDDWLSTPKFGQTIIHPEDKQIALNEARRAIETKTAGTTRQRFRHKAGHYVWCEARFTPIVQKNGKVTGIRGVITDISERMALEERKDEFIASASHELKTPLTSLKVFTQVLKSNLDTQSNPKTTKYLTRMEKEVDRLTKLVFDLLDLSKIQRGELPLTKKKMSLTALLTEVTQNLQPTIPQKISFKKQNAVYVHADEQRLNQVFTNLISNATKYSPDTSTIHITMSQSEDTVVVSVRDEGIGIAPEFQERVFQRFYRVFDEKDKTFPGLGMGLFISKTIIEHHKGKIWLESTPPEGSTFFVSLPIKAKGRRDNEKSVNHR